MTKQEIRSVMRACMDNRTLCRIHMDYDCGDYYYFPLKMSSRFFLGREEDDFILDGYAIRRFRDAVRAEEKADRYLEICREEGLLDQLTVPEIDLTDWKSICTSLLRMGENVILESEKEDPDDSIFLIGKMEKVCGGHLYFRHFDGDGMWEREPRRVPYRILTSVTFGSRYVNIFSKHLQMAANP